MSAANLIQRMFLRRPLPEARRLAGVTKGQNLTKLARAGDRDSQVKAHSSGQT